MNRVEIFVMIVLLTAFLVGDFTLAHISAIFLFEKWWGREETF